MKKDTSVRLRQLMNERNLKQVDILNLSMPFQRELDIKMGKSTLSQYVTGKQSPDQDRILLLSKTFNVSEPWLMGYDVEKERVSDNHRNIENDSQTPEFFAIQRNSKKLSQKEQQRLLKIMEATFDKLDNDTFVKDDSDDYL